MGSWHTRGGALQTCGGGGGGVLASRRSDQRSSSCGRQVTASEEHGTSLAHLEDPRAHGVKRNFATTGRTAEPTTAAHGPRRFGVTTSLRRGRQHALATAAAAAAPAQHHSSLSDHLPGSKWCLRSAMTCAFLVRHQLLPAIQLADAGLQLRVVSSEQAPHVLTVLRWSDLSLHPPPPFQHISLRKYAT